MKTWDQISCQLWSILCLLNNKRQPTKEGGFMGFLFKTDVSKEQKAAVALFRRHPNLKSLHYWHREALEDNVLAINLENLVVEKKYGNYPESCS